MTTSSVLYDLNPAYAKPIVLVPGMRKLTSKQKEELAKKIEDERKQDHRLVTGVFINVEVPGGDVTFPFRKYKDDPIMQYTLNDGQEYTLPKMICDHLNENCYTREHEHQIDTQTGSTKLYDKDGVVVSSKNFTHKKKHRFRFSITKWEN